VMIQDPYRFDRSHTNRGGIRFVTLEVRGRELLGKEWDLDILCRYKAVILLINGISRYEITYIISDIILPS